MEPSDAVAAWPDMAGDALVPETFDARLATEWPAARADWSAAFDRGSATPFQHGGVMEAWFRAMAGRSDVEPAIVSLHDRRSGAHAVSVALVRTSRGGCRTIAFADLGLVDYNAPILGPASPTTPEGCAALWRTLRRALPRADLIDLRKMPVEIGGRPNPLARRALPSTLNGNVVRIGDDWDAYRRGLKRTVRKELERSWRVFTRHPGAEFRPVTGVVERRRVLAAIESQQPIRMQAMGKTYALDAPDMAAFYRHLVESGDGSVLLTALVAGDEVVAALLGLRRGTEYIMLRISNAEEGWSHASPGRLIIDRSMEWLHGEGVRSFDFSIGNYDYKRRFGVEPVVLVDVVRALGWRGLGAVAEARARDWLSRRPRLRDAARRMLGRS